MFRRPVVPGVPMGEVPLLASWDAKSSAAQVRLSAHLDRLTTLVEVPDEEAELVVELRVGLPASRSLVSGGGDLDNYLLPVVRRLGPARVSGAFASKEHAEDSTIAVGPALGSVAAARPADLAVRTTGSAESRAWKEQIRQACAALEPDLTDGPLSLDIEFTLGPGRSWTNLWKPAIDALGPLLGLPDQRSPFAPNDDRIVQLGLHRTVDPRLGWAVGLEYWWVSAV